MTELALRSKRVWGYDARFMELVMPDMIVHPEHLAVEHGIVAEEDGAVVGYAIVRVDGKSAFLRDLFVEPKRLRHGIGAALFRQAMDYALEHGAQTLTLNGDPNAIGFYERMGMRKIAEEESIVGGGRMLRVMAIDLDPQALRMAPPSPLLDASLAILADGKPRTADEILAQGQKRGLFDATQTRKHIYTALSQYVQRTLGRGRKPLIVEDADRRFRLNQPIDDWPAIDITGLPPLTIPTAPPQNAQPTIAKLQAATAAGDFEAFERAVCATFELFGFATTHVGGNAAPDGYADALLGPLAYRVMLECKLGRDDTISQSNAVAEAAKYRDAYRAQYCALIAPSFDAEATFVSELHTHAVVAWTTDDLIRAATLRLDCSQMRALFAPGYAADPLDDLAWAQIHGPPKRLRVVASLIIEIGLEQQRMAHDLGDPASSPLLTRDVALSLIDDRLAAGGSTKGVTRDEVDAAFTWLTSPYVNRAIWTNDERDSRAAIVIPP